MIETAEDLLRKIQKLEKDHHHLKQKIISKLNNSKMELLKTPLTESQCENILESMGQSVFMFDLNDQIIYWNQMSEKLYGYTAEEALGKSGPDIIIGPIYSELAISCWERAVKGESWSGLFPVRNRYWEEFSVVTTLSPCRDENGIVFAVTCVCTDARPFHESSNFWNSITVPHRFSSHQLQSALASKISNFASKVKIKTKTGLLTNMDHDSDEGSEKKPMLHKVLAEAWRGKNGISSRFGWPWLHKDQEPQRISSEYSLRVETQLYESPSSIEESRGSSSCGTSSTSSINSDSIVIHTENLDVEISWDDLVIQEPIEQGSCATVYHALLYGSNVAVKIFNKQEYPDDVILSFRKEVCLMKRLRYPNILLFMGAVVSPQNLCIVTEFLPRGSLFRLLQHSTTKIDWKRCVHMAMDIARGMNYLHHCQPPIIHCNLKSSNILVDKNLTLKVGDFGLSRIKHGSYLTAYTKTGTPQWMAPEVLRNEQLDEKSDVYSYGVILWEIATRKIPWENHNLMQIVGAVGFSNQRLEIPNDVDPRWASLIKSCWSSEPQSRPTFQEIIIQLKDLLQKKPTVQLHGPGATKIAHNDA